MNGWERNGKRLCKGILWFPAYYFGALYIGLEPTPSVLIYVLVCSFWGGVLDIMWPTNTPSVPSTDRETPK